MEQKIKTQVMKHFNNGIAKIQIAKLVGLSRITVARIVKEYLPDLKTEKQKTTDSEIKEIIKLYNIGLSSIEIGKIVNRGKTTVRRVLKQKDIHIRGHLEANVKGEKHAKWNKSGKYISKLRGYVYIRVGKKWKKEHTEVWEKFHNKTVPKNMVIHHIDENKTNNDIENLMLLTIGEHNTIHTKNNKCI